MNSSKKLVRHGKLQKLIQKDPFLTDEQLAKTLKVSVPTVRLDRLSLNIPELRERIRAMASAASTRLKAIDQKDIVGELIDLELNKSAISTLTVTNEMVLGKTGVGRGYFMYAMADTLALALVDTEFALTAVGNVAVGNVKYKVPVYPDDRLVAKADVTNIKDGKYYIRVIIKKENTEVFRAKFIIAAVGNGEEFN